MAKAKDSNTFSDFEREAMKNRIQELRSDNGEQALLAKIDEMQEPSRALAKKIHEIVKKTAPSLTPKTWYGMPAYANKEGKAVLFFRPAEKFKERYSQLGFNDMAHLDEGNMWPVVYAVTKLTPTEEVKIADLVKKAVS